MGAILDNTNSALYDIEDDEVSSNDSKDRQQKRKKRESYAPIITAIVVIYLLSVLVLVYLQGFGAININDSVFIALLTTTTANVISVLFAVVRYWFSK